MQIRMQTNARGWLWLTCATAIALAPLAASAQAISSEPLAPLPGSSAADPRLGTPITASAPQAPTAPRAPVALSTPPVARPAPAAEPVAAPVMHADNSTSMLGRSEPGSVQTPAVKHPSGISAIKKAEAKKLATAQAKPKPKAKPKLIAKAVTKPKPKTVKPKLTSPADGANG